MAATIIPLFQYVAAGVEFALGLTFGETDDYGYNVVRDPVTRPRLARNATALPGNRSHQTDIQIPGRQHRLTDVHGRVVREIVG